MEEVETKNARTSRNTELRGFAEGRVVNERPPIVFGTGSRFNLPTSLVQRFKDNGKQVAFVVYESSGETQRENYYQAVDKGYRPLAASEAPELARQYELSPFDERKESEQLIRRGGQIAMQRDWELKEAEDKHYDGEVARQNVMSEMYRLGATDSRYPKPLIDERTRGYR